MNITISELFKQYKNNISKWNELEQSLMKPNEKSAWYQDFYDTMASFQIIYDSNKDIILQITNILADMDEATADEMFNELFTMHIENRDSEFLIYVSGKLIDYYEKNEDIPKLIHLYTLRENNMLIIGNPEVMGKRYDCSDTIKAMSYLDRYCEFDEGTRYRIWVAFYNYIARMTDFGVVDICDALDRYDQLIEVSSNPQIISLDEGCDKIANIRGYLNQAMFVCIALIDRTDMKGRERFYQYTKKYFETNAMELNSVYELPAELYACHLFNQYMEKSLDIDEAFKQMVEYIRYKNRLVQKKSEYSQDEVIQSINVIRYLTNLGKYVTNQKMVSDAVSELMYIAQSNWVKSNLIFYERMSDMLGKACISLISFDVPGIAKEKCITQLIVQRDIHVYIDAKVTAEIALAIYRAITTTDIAFFEKETSIPASRWKDFLYYSSMFHDIGRERIIGNVVVRSRPMFEQEIIRSRMHTTYGAIAMESLKGIEKYADVIKGHHTYYNLENIDEYEYDRGNSEVNPFTDIVALASYIAKETDYFWDFEKKSCKFKKLLKSLPKSKDNRFNPRVIDVLLEDEVLQTEIEKLVTQYRKDVVFDVYHNWEKIQLSQDEDSMLEGCANAYNEFRNTKDDEAIMPFLKDLEYLSVSSNEAVRNKALYIMMQYYFFMGQFEYGMSISREIEPYIKKSKNYERLIDFYSSVGRAETVRDNTAAAFTAYLSALWFCDKTPGTDDVKNMCYLDIACIFAAKYNYARAKDYYDKCKLDCLNIDEQLQYLCMNGYCHVKLGLRERLSEIRDEIRTLIINNKSHVIYPHYVYLAVFADELGDKDGFAEALDEMAKQEIIAEDIAYYSDEMFMYIELLIKCGKVKRASELIDTYIEMCGDRKEYSSALTKLYNIKIRVIARQKGYSEISEYEERIKAAFCASIQEEALKIEEIEKRLYEEIRIKAEHEEILNSKEVLEESVKKAKSDSEYKSQFLSSMSHEIRTPINAILGFNEMIVRESTEEQVQNYASNIDHAGRQLLGIINDILDYSKIEAGKMVIVPQNYYIRTLIDDIVNMVSPKLSEKNLDFNLDCSEGMPDELLGDDLRIKQILLNLLSNATKYTKKGQVTFTINYEKIDESSVLLKFSVSDTGIGLKPEQIEKIANPFERFELSENHSVEGTGLGMNIVTRLLEQMDSHLVIESEFGVGSTFSFALKQNVIDWNSSSQIDAARRRLLVSSGDKRVVRKGLLYAPNAKVLVVDDNAVNLKVAVALLKRTDIQVTSASSGRECLKLCQENEYNVILLDHMMPDMDGIETLQKLKASGGANATIPVVALTANVVDSADDFYQNSGFDALLTKPIDADKMEELLASLLPDYLLEK